MTVKDRLIVALDFDSKEKAEKMIEILGDSVSFYKVGLELFLNTGGSILDILASHKKRIFLDLKFHDIPNTVAAACRFAAGLESVSMFNIHASGGAEMIAKSVATKREDQILLAVTALTSLDDKDVDVYLKTSFSVSQLAQNLAQEAQKAGASGVVCSAQEAKNIKESCGQGFITVCPGIRFSDSDMGDQKRVLSPKEALENGADYLVVGRPITGAENPRAMAERMLQEMEH